MNTNEVDDSCRDLVNRFRGALPFLETESSFEVWKEKFRNQLKGALYLCRFDRNYPRIIQGHIDDLESIQFSAVAARLPAFSPVDVVGQGGNQ